MDIFMSSSNPLYPARRQESHDRSQRRYQQRMARTARKVIRIKLILITLVNVVAIILCAIYAISVHQHWNVVRTHQDQLVFPNLDLQDLKKGYIAAVGRIGWVFLLVPSAAFAPIWFNLVLEVAGLAWEIILGNIAENNFGYIVTVGYGEIYPATSGQCTNGMLSDDQKSFYATFGSISGESPTDVCKGFAFEGSVLQAYIIVGIFAGLLLLLLAGAVAFSSKRERGKLSLTETAFSYITSLT